MAVALAATGLLVGCGEEPIPEQVTFEPTIRLLFAAHCVRCHGAGGTLNSDPRLTVLIGNDVPALAYLDRYADTGDCTLDPVTMAFPPSCKHGALSNAQTIKLYAVTAKPTEGMRMPPAPSDPLTDWEKKLLVKWCDNPMP